MTRRFAIGLMTLLLTLVASTSANAGVVTVGSSLAGDFSQTSYGGSPNTWINSALATPGANLTSPVDGIVIRWRMTGNFSGGPFRLRVLRPDGLGKYSGVNASAPVIPTGAPATQSFPTNMAIKAGDTIGIDPSQFADKIGTRASPGPGFNIAYWQPQIVQGDPPRSPDGSFSGVSELGFNADVLAPPTISAISPAAGSVTGTTSVVISGTNFAEIQEVKFGAVPAASYTVNSDNQLTAVAPKSTTLSSVAVSVSTLAGAATSASAFQYTACKVPKLKKKTLKAAKKSLKKAGCKLGKVNKTGGVTSKTGRVKSQKKKAGKLLAPGTKVNLTLGPK